MRLLFCALALCCLAGTSRADDLPPTYQECWLRASAGETVVCSCVEGRPGTWTLYRDDSGRVCLRAVAPIPTVTSASLAAKKTPCNCGTGCECKPNDCLGNCSITVPSGSVLVPVGAAPAAVLAHFTPGSRVAYNAAENCYRLVPGTGSQVGTVTTTSVAAACVGGSCGQSRTVSASYPASGGRCGPSGCSAPGWSTIPAGLQCPNGRCQPVQGLLP